MRLEMKQVIEGKVYDTETAELLHEWRNGEEYGDFHHLVECLFRTPKGSYFLAGEGGAMTGYVTRVGNNEYSGGHAITPLLEAEAIEWLEEHGGTDALLEYFPETLEEA